MNVIKIATTLLRARADGTIPSIIEGSIEKSGRLWVITLQKGQGTWVDSAWLDGFQYDAIRFMLGQEMPGVSKKRPFQSLFHAQDKINSGLVYNFLDGILGFANGLLGFALTLLQGALNLKVRIAHGFPGALFDRAGSLISHALDLVGSAAHDWSPDELKAARSPALHIINA
jgi:hypothetical protein